MGSRFIVALVVASCSTVLTIGLTARAVGTAGAR